MPSTTVPTVAERVFADWQRRTAGRDVEYLATIVCGICGFSGRHRFLEHDGVLIETDPIRAQGPILSPEQWTLTHVLRQAATTSGIASVNDFGAKGLKVSLDPEPSAIDDEFSYRARQITIT